MHEVLIPNFHNPHYREDVLLGYDKFEDLLQGPFLRKTKVSILEKKKNTIC